MTISTQELPGKLSLVIITHECEYRKREGLGSVEAAFEPPIKSVMNIFLRNNAFSKPKKTIMSAFTVDDMRDSDQESCMIKTI